MLRMFSHFASLMVFSSFNFVFCMDVIQDTDNSSVRRYSDPTDTIRNSKMQKKFLDDMEYAVPYSNDDMQRFKGNVAKYLMPNSLDYLRATKNGKRIVARSEDLYYFISSLEMNALKKSRLNEELSDLTKEVVDNIELTKVALQYAALLETIYKMAGIPELCSLWSEISLNLKERSRCSGCK